MKFSKIATLVASALAVASVSLPAQADDCDEACKAARKAQDPLADTRAILTDNTISIGKNRGNTGYAFQIQPVYSITTEYGFNVILRGVIPISGVYRAAGPPGPLRAGYVWGLSDTILQAFFVPETDGAIKFGFGPQVSLPTRTNSVLAGPGWGGGFAAVAFGFAGNLSYGGIIGHHWGQKSFSVTTIQPIVMYNMDLFGGSYLGYNNSITYNWSGKAGSRWQVPVGLTFGKTFVLDGGYAVDASIGAYALAAKARGGPNAQIKFGVSVFFP